MITMNSTRSMMLRLRTGVLIGHDSPQYFSITMDQIITSNSVATLNNHFGNNTIGFSTFSVIIIVARILLAFNPILFTHQLLGGEDSETSHFVRVSMQTS